MRSISHPFHFIGLMKCSLQEFQHMFPQLTSCIKTLSGSANNINNNMPNYNNEFHQSHHITMVNEQQHDLQFFPMECPILPLDTEFKYKNMLHDEFCVEKGPLWRVQLIDESTMDLANLSFGPELNALLEDTTIEQSTRWRYFLRYQQGSVNQVSAIKQKVTFLNRVSFYLKLFQFVSPAGTHNSRFVCY